MKKKTKTQTKIIIQMFHNVQLVAVHTLFKSYIHRYRDNVTYIFKGNFRLKPSQ